CFEKFLKCNRYVVTPYFEIARYHCGLARFRKLKSVGFACFFHLAAEIGCFPFGIEGDFWQACSVGRFFSSGLAEWEMSVFGRNFIIYYPRT
uniref:hypothetical protein n=1 Tax=Alistipes putredinis TaxID=28117 RepID=UPI003FD8DCD0